MTDCAESYCQPVSNDAQLQLTFTFRGTQLVLEAIIGFFQTVQFYRTLTYCDVSFACEIEFHSAC